MNSGERRPGEGERKKWGRQIGSGDGGGGGGQGSR